MLREMHAPTIELEGARLRPLRASDAVALHDYLQDPAVTERTSYPTISMPWVESMIERSVNRWANGELAKWGLARGDDRLIGTCGFNDHSAAHRWAELAYDLAPACWGTGLMCRAVDAVLQWGFAQDRIDRAHAYVRVDNDPSIGLLQRIGFAREGRLRSYRVCRGVRHDFFVYGLLRAEWANDSA